MLFISPSAHFVSALRHKASRYTQVFLFWAGVIIGGRLIWTVNKAPWRVNLAQVS
jgi:hypothetical protein